MGCCQGGFSGGGGGGGVGNPWQFIGNFAHEFFSTDNTETDLIMTALPANSVLEAIRIITVEAFEYDGAPGAYNVQVGVFGALDLYIPYFDAQPLGTRQTVWTFDENDVAGWNVRIGVQAVSSLDLYLAGSMDIWLKYWTVPAGS